MKDTITFIDLFAGIGGMRLGFESIGAKCVYTSEWDEYSRTTYQANFGTEDIAGDITDVEPGDIPDHDVLLAGFPCQPFSLAGVSKKNSLGRPHGFACEIQGTLFFDVAAHHRGKTPAGAFLLENVRNLVSHDTGNTFRVIRRALDELGYHIHYRIIDAQDFVPQHRERIFIAGFREPVGFEWGDTPSAKHSLSEVLDTEPVAEKYVLSDKLWNYLQAYAEKHRAKGNGFGCSVFGPDDVARTLSARYFKDGSEILISRGAGLNPRRLTPRECGRLMGYPESFEIPVSDTRAYKQFGNSVVVPVIRHIAQLMKPYLDPGYVYNEAEFELRPTAQSQRSAGHRIHPSRSPRGKVRRDSRHTQDRCRRPSQRRRIARLQPEQHACDETIRRQRARNPDSNTGRHQPSGFLQHHADHADSRSAQRHPNADLARPPRHGIRHHSVDSDGRHEESEKTEESGEVRDQASRHQGPFQLFIRRAQREHRYIRRHARDSSPDAQRRSGRIAFRSDHEDRSLNRADGMVEARVEARMGTLVGTMLLRVGGHPDNFVSLARRRVFIGYPMPDGVGAGIEAAGKLLVDHADLRASLRIG